MVDWLSYLSQMAVIRDASSLAQQYAQAVTEYAAATHVWLIAPEQCGRKLGVVNDLPSLAWQVNEFSHPFSHVLQSTKPMILDDESLVYWQQNNDFEQLTQVVSHGQSVLVMPLPPAHRRIEMMLVIVSNATQLAQLIDDNHWQNFSKVFIEQWRIIRELRVESQQKHQLDDSIKQLKQDERKTELAFELSNQLIGQSEPMQKLRQQVATAAQSELSVLIQGDTGTGKELVAQAVHQISSRSHRPFVAINCAAIPENLLESELFGYEKGAFSGADTSKQGLIADADGGTLFLDEIGDMPLALQAKLLRVIENKSYRRLGGSDEFQVDFRLVAATHVALKQRFQQGDFRQDLYYRLNQFPLKVPALSQRKTDIEPLCRYFIAQYNQVHQTHVVGMRYAALDAIKHYDFPGNVRELKNLVEFACAHTADHCEIEAEAFAERSLTNESHQDIHHQTNENSDFKNIIDLKQAVNEFEYDVIRSRLASFDGDRAKAAASLGLPKRTLAHKCQKMEID